MSNTEIRERLLMWQNFLNACKLGAVVEAADTGIWQKHGKFMWKRIGSAAEYSADSIACPVRVLLEGVE